MTHSEVQRHFQSASHCHNDHFVFQVYCMEYLEKNADWLRDRLQKYKDHYVLFDCPGQVELYTHNNAVKNLVEQLTKWNYRCAEELACNLVDWHDEQIKSHVASLWLHKSVNAASLRMSQYSQYDCVVTGSARVLQVDCGAPGGLALLRRPQQVHLYSAHVAVHHAAGGAASCQRPLQRLVVTPASHWMCHAWHLCGEVTRCSMTHQGSSRLVVFSKFTGICGCVEED